MITTTIEDLFSKIQLLKKVDLTINDKLTHAIKRIDSQYNQQTRIKLAQLRSKIQNEIRIPKAAVDESGIIVVQKNYENPDPDGFKFKPADLVFVNQQSEKLYEAFNTLSITIDGFIVKDITEDGFNRLVDRKDAEGKIIPAVFDAFEMEELAGILFPSPDDVVVAPALEVVTAEATPDHVEVPYV